MSDYHHSPDYDSDQRVSAADDISERLDQIEQSVCDKLDQIEQAVKDSRLDLSWVGFVLVGWLVLAGLADLWHTKARYSLWYGVYSDEVTIEQKPTDCNFFRAPLGEKGCHYDRQVNTVRVKTETVGFPGTTVNYVSFDNGETWTVDTANPRTKPQVVVSWEKVEDQE